MASENDSKPLKEIILRAWTDPKFKQRLKSNPTSVFSDFGIKTGDATRITVVENGSQEIYFVLPKQPDLTTLSDSQIRELIDSVLGVQLVLPTVLD